MGTFDQRRQEVQEQALQSPHAAQTRQSEPNFDRMREYGMGLQTQQGEQDPAAWLSENAHGSRVTEEEQHTLAVRTTRQPGERATIT